jgi:prepilin-type processing-associated H-X9-DG protein
MNATFTATTAALYGLGAALLLAPSAVAKPAAHKPAAPRPAPAAPSPAVALVRLYLAARQAQQEDKAYALLSPNTQTQFPPAQRDQLTRELADPNMFRALPPGVLPVMALFVDVHDTLHFKFRVLGPSLDDPAIVLVRAYQVGAPMSTIQTLQVVTMVDSAAGGALRVDGEKTAMLAAPALMGERAKAMQEASQSNLKQIALGIIMYTQDHNEKMPDADKWVSEIMPYVRNEAVFRDPAAPGLKWGYAFNRTLSGVSLADLDEPAQTVLLFESTDGKKNAADAGASVPTPGRHNGGTDYALADGHVKWEADGTKPSFLLTGK